MALPQLIERLAALPAFRSLTGALPSVKPCDGVGDRMRSWMRCDLADLKLNPS